MQWIEALIFLAAAVLLATGFRNEVAEAIRQALENFRGGPPSPMHPSPADDSALLRRRASKL